MGTQCSKCTMRFKQRDQYKKHMDSHKKQSHSTRSRSIPHSWYSSVNVSPNIQLTELKLSLEIVNDVFNEGTQSTSKDLR